MAAVSLGVELVPLSSGILTPAPEADDRVMAHRAVKVVAYALGYGHAGGYITACENDRGEVRARLRLRASCVWAL